MSKTTIAPALRQQVAERDNFSCAYCQSQEVVIGSQLTVDHIVPEVLGGGSELSNLCLACWACNLSKGQRIAAVDPETGDLVALFHPVKQVWAEHFVWQAEGSLLQGLSASGRATVRALKLNRPLLVQARKRWVRVGWHPPTYE